MTGESEPDPDPTRIRSVAVHREDVANALEATLRSDRTVVLRVTPPYSGRMRARIHRVGTGATDGVETTDRTEDGDTPIHLDPRDLVRACPTYPEADDTVAEQPDTDPKTRRRRHVEAVEAWRERVRESVGGTVTIPVLDDGNRDGGDDDDATDGRSGTHEVDVVALG